jgi:UDP-glucose:(glucosyl)LPS alpha-1,3-glucosyltransferase
MKIPISISFSVSDNYSQHLAVVLTSFLVNNPDSRFMFHVLHRNISEENQTRIRKLESMYANCEIKFHLLDANTFEQFAIPLYLEHVTVETYFRYCLPELLFNESRTIYSDVDVICRSDVREIWEMDLAGKIMAAVRNYEGEQSGQQDDIVRLGFSPNSPYFFTGFLVMDLERMREEKTSQKWMSATEKYGNQVSFIDLDIMNLVCEGDIYEIDPVWNETARYSPFRRNVKIWHFPGFVMKPWCNIWKNTTWPIYLKYLLKSPYKSNALRFILGHVKGFFFFKYTKKQVTRYLICGIRVWRKKV